MRLRHPPVREIEKSRMIKDDYMDRGSAQDTDPSDRFDERYPASRRDYADRTRSDFRGRHHSTDDDQQTGMRRRRRIREMRPEEVPSAPQDFRSDRNDSPDDFDSYRASRSYDRYERRDGGSSSVADYRREEPDTDYRARYRQRFESNRRHYNDSDDGVRESARYRRTSDTREEDHSGRGRSGYRSYDNDQSQRRQSVGRSYRRDQDDRPSYAQRSRRSFDDQDGGGRRDTKRNFGSKNNRSPKGANSSRQSKGPRRKPVQPTYDQPEISADEPIRLNKYIANSGVCSRREADDLIAAGAVLVNGSPVTTLGTKVTINDRVEVNRQEVKPESKVYVLLNKPRNCVTTSDDPQERMTVVNLVRSAAKERIYPVGRLDRNTTGVLLLTNDGELAAKLVHPSFEKKKIYHAWLDKEVSPEDMQKLADGIELEDGEMHADAISYVTDDDHTQVGIEIHSGRNRIVRRLFEALGYRVVKLDRVYFAGLTKKNLGRGKWRYLTQEEVDNLKMGAFE